MTRRPPIFEVDHQLSEAAVARIRRDLPGALHRGLPIILEPGIRFAGTYEPRPRIRLAHVERWLTR